MIEMRLTHQVLEEDVHTSDKAGLFLMIEMILTQPSSGGRRPHWVEASRAGEAGRCPEGEWQPLRG